MSGVDSGARSIQAAHTAAEVRGLRPEPMEVLHRSTNDLYLLPRDEIVLRVSTGAGAPERATMIQDLTRWLATEHGFPTVEPLAGHDVVVIDDATAVGFWHYYPQRHAEFQSFHLPSLLRELHAIPLPTHIQVPHWQPLASLHIATTDPVNDEALTDSERTWILDQIGQICDMLSETSWPLGWGLIHGDAWAGNLLWGAEANTVLLGDWDWTSIGPREIDLIPTWHASVRYGRSPQWAQGFATTYGYDLSPWEHYPDLLRMRDFVQLSGPIRRSSASPPHRARLRQRLDDLMAGNTTTSWAQA